MRVGWFLGGLYALREDPVDFDEDDGWDEDDHDTTRQPFSDEFAALAAWHEPNSLTDAQVVRWEIVNSCAMADFTRVAKLYARLGELEPERDAEHHAAVGQLKFRRAQPDLQPKSLMWWQPIVYPARWSCMLSMARWALALDGPRAATDPVDPLLGDAAHHFQTALDSGFLLPSVHRAVLARCRFEDRHFLRAAEYYDRVLSDGLALQGENAKGTEDVKVALYIATARSFLAAHEAARAQARLEACLREFPVHGPAYRELAELHATKTDFEAAYNVLQRWAEAEPALKSDIWVRTLQALGETSAPPDWQGLVEEYLSKNPERLEAVQHAVQIHWANLRQLSEEARKEWLYGCYTLWWATVPAGYDSVYYPAVIRHFALAVEIELRETVFRPVIERVKKEAHLVQAIVRRKDRRADCWQEWLRNGKISLGQMLIEVNPSRTRDLQPWDKLQDRAARRFLGVRRQFGLLEADKLLEFRNPAAHRTEPLSKKDAIAASAVCVKFLTAMLSSG